MTGPGSAPTPLGASSPPYMVDCDTHVLEPADLWETHLEHRYRDRAIVVRDVDGVETLLADGRPVMAGTLAGLGGAHLDRRSLFDGTRRYIDGCPPASYDPAARVALLDQTGIDAAVVFPTIGILPLPIEDHDLLSAYARAYNRWMAGYAADAGGRVLPVAQLHLGDVEEAVTELDRCLARGFRAVFVPPEPVGDRLLSDPILDPLWHRCAEAGVPICLHVVVRFGAGMPFEPWLQRGAGMLFGFTLGAPGQLLPALANLVLGGVFDRVPGLRVVLVEAGAGWAPLLMDRLRAKHRTLGVLSPAPLRRPPDEYLAEHCWFVAEPEERTIEACLDLVGDDRILWGSDYPHIDADIDAADLVRATTASLSPRRRAAVLGGAARALFGG